jgi:hypothetical protein
MNDGSKGRDFLGSSAASTETRQQFVARLRADLAALKSEQSLPIANERRTLVKRWIELIELELKRLGENHE